MAGAEDQPRQCTPIGRYIADEDVTYLRDQTIFLSSNESAGLLSHTL